MSGNQAEEHIEHVKEIRCKFSIMDINDPWLNPWRCVLVHSCVLQCEGKEPDKINCPFWNKLYHITLSPDKLGD